MTTWINNKLIEIKYDKLDYWTMYVNGDLSLEELLKLIKVDEKKDEDFFGKHWNYK